MIPARYRPGITAADRVIHNGKVYGVEAVADVHSSRRELHLMCKAVGDCHHPANCHQTVTGSEMKKAGYCLHSRLSSVYAVFVVGRAGFEPATNGLKVQKHRQAWTTLDCHQSHKPLILLDT